jgi:hypothetical protein
MLTLGEASALCSVARSLSTNNLSHSNSLSDFGIDNDDNILEDVVESGESPDTGMRSKVVCMHQLLDNVVEA